MESPPLCPPRMEYEEFGVCRGYVCADPEGRWVEIMDYIGDFKTPDVELRPVGIPDVQLLGVTQLTNTLHEIFGESRYVLSIDRLE